MCVDCPITERAFPDPMRCHVFCATSLDGYIARPDGGIDWLPQDSEFAGDDHGYAAFMAGIDALVMGRKTFELVLTFGSWPYTKPVFVVTHRALPKLPPTHAGAVLEAVSGSPQQIVAHIAAKGFRSLYVDGGQVVTQFLAAGLIDSMTLTRVPVLIGEGIPLFGRRAGGPAMDAKWRLARSQSWPNGLVQSVYERR